MEYTTQVFTVKRIHNIRDFSYEVELSKGFSLTDLVLYLNAIGKNSFFWTEGKYLHATSDEDWLNLLPQEVRKGIKAVGEVKKGYLAQSELSRYTAFALFTADFNRIFSPNFKANPLFKRLKRRTKEGWNLSGWMKFLHELSLNYKLARDGIEYQIWRWLAMDPQDGGYLIFAFKGGISINKILKEILKRFNAKTLKKFFAFRVKGTHRIGRLKELKGEELTLTFDGAFESTVPAERVIPIFIPPPNWDWREKDRTQLLKHLRLKPKVICTYEEIITEVINKLLEPYMVQIQKADLRGERIETSSYVVVDKPIEENGVGDYILEERKVYNVPFESLKLNFVDLCLKLEKNKKILRDAESDLLQNLKLFLKDIGVSMEVNNLTFDKKLKKFDLEMAEAVIQFFEEKRGILESGDFNLVLIPFAEFVTENIYALPLVERIKETLNGLNYHLLTDREIKVFFKTQKVATKRRILLELLKEIFKSRGGSLYILDEPLPFGKVAIETEKGFELYNLFGELLGIEKEFTPDEGDLLVTFNPERLEKNVVVLDGWVTPYALKGEGKNCLSAERGVAFPVNVSSSVVVLTKKTPYDYKTAFGTKIGDNLDTEEVEKTLINLSKVVDFLSLQKFSL
ncbi:MAG TPA: hypothetical protein EYH37_03670 [Aquifex aeolicus]|uniref:Uncharacterized protein n=1 Tax=Aquifex aeolicus TaxID=63363 RepID=A0A9D0YPT5_AQUAO|nr:hypothetical protein [Aquifex aeolicus]